MKKKGFTLVELLAVIAILAILVIIALPNVLGMFRTAKKNTFITELENIMRGAENQYMSDTMTMQGVDGIAYGRSGGYKCINQENPNGKAPNGGDVKFGKLDLSGTANLDYYIEFNSAGKVIKFFATNGEYQYAYWGKEGLNLEEIVGEEINSESGTAADYTFFDKTNGFKDTTEKYKIKTNATTKKNDFTGVGKYSRVLTIADGLEYCKNDFTGDTNKQDCKFQYLKIQPTTCEVAVWKSSTEQTHVEYNS